MQPEEQGRNTDIRINKVWNNEVWLRHPYATCESGLIAKKKKKYTSSNTEDSQKFWIFFFDTPRSNGSNAALVININIQPYQK